MKPRPPMYVPRTPFVDRPLPSGILVDMYVCVLCAAALFAVGYSLRYRQDEAALDRQRETITALQHQLAPESLPQETPGPLAGN